VIDDDADPRRWRTLDDLLHSDKGVTVGRDDDGKLTPTIGNPGSTKAPDLMVSIDPVTVAKIRSHLETQGIEDSPRAYLFATRDGQLPDPSNVQKMWKAAVRKAGLGNVTPAIGTHDLRRFSARPCTRTAYPWQSSKPDSGTLTSASPRSTSVLAQKPTGRRLTPLQPLWLASPIRRSKPQTQPTVLVAARVIWKPPPLIEVLNRVPMGLQEFDGFRETHLGAVHEMPLYGRIVLFILGASLHKRSCEYADRGFVLPTAHAAS